MAAEDNIVSDAVRCYTAMWGIATEDERMEYLRSLQPGERVQETEKSSCLSGRQGTVYRNDGGGTCVLWDRKPGEYGQMGTSVTWGTWRVADLDNNSLNERGIE